MQVVFCTYPWAFDTPGGGEIQLRKYAEHLPAHGVNVKLHDPWSRNIADAEIVHFFSCVGGSIHLCNYIKQRGIPLVVSSSLWISDANRHLYPIDEIRQQLMLADVIVTNSEMESRRLSEQLSIPHDRFRAVYNGCEPQFGSADPRVFQQATGITGDFILNVGNIEPRKNQLGLVQALSDFDLPIVLIGGIRDASYATRVLSEGGSKVYHMDQRDHADPCLVSAFAACKIFVLPSLLETPGLAALEASIAGAPLVITSEGSTPEYFGKLAHYVDPCNIQNMRDAAKAALARGANPLLKKHVEANFLWSNVTKTIPEIYQLAIERNAGLVP